MAVNFSARQIGHPGALPRIERALRESGMRADRLLVEVTESTVLQDTEAAQLAFAQICKLGAEVAIDDFGTGYSSLLYLKRYPIAVLKIDRQFVSGMGNEDDHAIVASVISLAHAVGAVCTAEGVETMDQFAALVELGCEYAQGYLFGRPVPASELPDVITQAETHASATATGLRLELPNRAATGSQPAKREMTTCCEAGRARSSHVVGSNTDLSD